MGEDRGEKIQFSKRLSVPDNSSIDIHPSPVSIYLNAWVAAATPYLPIIVLAAPMM